jgi:dipeptidyl aminopeptidase/acylaminoacyl peptidase
MAMLTFSRSKRNAPAIQLLLVVSLAVPLAVANCQAQDRPFTVRDSIEMTTFIDPETRVGDSRDFPVRFSPDGSYFAVVTSRGVIQSDEIESTLWVFDSEAVRGNLRSHGAEKAVVPRVIARLATVTNDIAVIADVRWSTDSRSLWFLGQNSSRRWQLYQGDVLNGIIHPLTSPEVDVSRYELSSNGGVYAAAIPNESLEKALKGQAINGDAAVVTGVPLDAILFPSLFLQSEFWKSHELWRIHDGANVRIIDPALGKPVQPIAADDGYGNILSVSPDGHSAIFLRPIKHWNPVWDSYEPDDPNHKFHADAGAAKPFTPWFELPAEYALVDLIRGKTSSLVNAPLARWQGYGQPTKTMWSQDGRKVLLGATYLSLDDIDPEERSLRSRPCAATVVEIGSAKITCARVMDRTADPNALFVSDVTFGKSDEEVIVRVVNIDRKEQPAEIYRQQGGTWKREASSQEHKDASSNNHGVDEAKNPNVRNLSVFVRQGLNQPPALFASALGNDDAKKIWDPNPQLSTMKLDLASVLRWKDSSGYEWVAGLVMPPDYVSGKKYPLVIQTHGFRDNWFLTDGGYTTALAARPLSSAGFIVLQMPYNPEHFNTQQEIPDQLRGFESGIDLLLSKGLIEPTRVGIIGFSRTCYYVEEALVKAPMRFAAATIADGVDQSYVQYLSLAGWGVQVSEQEMIYGAKPFGRGLKTWMDYAPGFHLDKVKVPVRIEANSGIRAVLGEWEIYSSLYMQGKPVDLISFPDGAHPVVKPLERLASQQGNVDWFRFWLKDEEDPDPAKAEQYKRWRELRELQQASETGRKPN